MTNKGYQIIEPPILDDFVANAAHEGLYYSILCWIVDNLRKCNDPKLKHVEIEIIPVTYVGTYPAIGVYYKDSKEPDVEDIIEQKITNIIKKLTVLDYCHFAFNLNVSWDFQYKDFVS